jgi:hypothetical protein
MEGARTVKQRILKYQIGEPFNGFKTVEMPPGAQVISAIWQQSGVVIYAIVGGSDWPEELMVDRKFCVVGTGWEIEPGLQFVTTLPVGAFVWHVMEKR